MRGSEKDQDVQVFLDVVELVGNVLWRRRGSIRLGGIVLVPSGQAATAGDDVIDLVFEVRSLQVLGSGCEIVKTEAHFRNGQELKVPVLLRGMSGFDLGQGVRGRLHRDPPQNIE